MRRRRLPKAETEKKWLAYLNDVKLNMDIGEVTNMSYLANKHGVTHTFCRFLTNSNIIKRDEKGFFRWNEKIPVTIKLINSYRKFQHEDKLKYPPKLANKNKPIQQEFNFADPKTRKKKQKQLNVAVPIQEKQIGLIRKFLKWIY